MIRTRSEQNYNSKTGFETRRENQGFERHNISMSRPHLDLTLFGTNNTNGTTSSIDSIPVGTKAPEPKKQTRPTDLPTQPKDLLEQQGKAHVSGDPDPDSSWSDSSPDKYNYSNDSSSSKSIKKKFNTKKNLWKHRKQDASESSSRYSDSSDDSDYRCKRRKKKSHRKKDSIKLCARLTEKLLTTAYKLKIIRFKPDEDPLQCRIYFLAFVESLEIIFTQYKETC